jgi:hypothetical protein
MVRATASALLALVGILAISSAAAAGGPPASLVQAFRKTESASSAKLALVEQIQVGSQTAATVHLTGVAQPRAHAGSFVFSVTPTTAALGKASEIQHGSKVYVHYAALDRLHKKNKRVKSWVVVDSASSLGVNPATIDVLGIAEVRQLTNVRSLGHVTRGGVQVTRYSAALDLAKGSATPGLQQLMAHLPSALAALVFGGTEHFVISVGTDGYVHEITTTLGGTVAGTTLRIDIDIRQSDFNASPGAIAPPAASNVMTIAQFDRALGITAPGNAALLEKVALSPSQVGAGYTLSQIPGGQLVQGEKTLDFCNKTYASESFRTSRLQVVYQKKGSKFAASNEVVTYKPGGAKKALSEVAHALRTCRNGVVPNPPAGVTQLVRHTTRLHDPHLLPGSVAVLEVDVGIVNGRRATQRSVAVYQVRGNVLSGVYGYGKSVALIEAQTLKIAERSAADLKHYIRTSTGPVS